MKTTILSILLCALFFHSFAQKTGYITGTVTDSVEKLKFANATICIINAKDSILYDFTHTTPDGSFTINTVKNGTYILLVSYPDYADYVERFKIDSLNNVYIFGNINMVLKSRLLKDVIIRGTVTAIKIKGDTTEFNAKAYVIQPNSKVEDLLKQLPGIQIDNNGKITAQGQTVNKVLVDGEEFFGDDPTLVTKNIRGDMVDKIQLYDKKSDQATFTGIDDGKKIKTINVKLKEDKKNGYFGKVEGGYATGDYYQGQGMFNSFHPKSKLAVYGIIANTGKIGLGWEDRNKYSSGAVELSDGGIILSGGGSRDDLESFDGKYNGQGIPEAISGGVHYDNKWNNDKESINTNYKAGYLSINGFKNTATQNNLPSSLINSYDNQEYKNSMYRQKLDFIYQKKLDTTSNLKIAVDMSLKNSKTATSDVSLGEKEDGTLLNDNSRILNNTVDQQIFNASEFYAKKLKKNGRTVSINFSQSVNNSDANGYLNSTVHFYNSTGLLDSTQKINQYKTNGVKNTFLTTNITFTEPLTRQVSLVGNYGMGLNNNHADRKSFNPSTTGLYNVLDTAYSNNYELNQFSNQIGVFINFKAKKSTLNIGTKAAEISYRQTNEYTGDLFKRQFINWYPQANYSFKISQQASFKINYSGYTTQPNIDQIQPLKINNDPLNITMGNPGLKPSFTNAITFAYASFKILTNQTIYLNGSYNFSNNSIVDNTFTSSTGINTSQAINLSGKTNYNYSLSGYIAQKIAALNTDVGIDITASGNVGHSFVNSLLNTNETYTYATNLSISKFKQKGYDFKFYAGPNYTISQSSLQPEINNNGFGLTGNIYYNLYLPGDLIWNSSIDYQYRGKTKSFNETFSRVIFNTGISKPFLKQKNLKASVAANDLFNQNQAFIRNSNGNLITQTTYSTIKRYVLFSLSWDFTSMNPKK